ncbi:SRPBCC family protein [Burkholderia anthina]|uniref:SRPBCC family protein n=1 Tax=Burkholderia anthina TaxID=179879 RepID=UPI001CF45434|nr:SRPBCC family protein [Burkholderia anthina]MCA8090449.1 SRPBCC family protein [Burkholderia anthina]
MKVVIEKVFPIASSIDATWQCLQDIEAVAGCMPGARITERIDAEHYKGTVTVRIGPAAMSFKGSVDVQSLDAAQHTLHLTGKGADSTGTSGASMDLVASVQAADSGCQLTGRSEVAMNGKAAAFGGRMMQTVADQILGQFAGNFAALVVARGGQAADAAGDAQAADAPGIAPSGTAPSQAPTPAAEPAVAPHAAELNGLALLWAVLRDWLRGLFSRKTA